MMEVKGEEHFMVMPASYLCGLAGSLEWVVVMSAPAIPPVISILAIFTAIETNALYNMVTLTSKPTNTPSQYNLLPQYG